LKIIDWFKLFLLGFLPERQKFHNRRSKTCGWKRKDNPCLQGRTFQCEVYKSLLRGCRLQILWFTLLRIANPCFEGSYLRDLFQRYKRYFESHKNQAPKELNFGRTIKPQTWKPCRGEIITLAAARFHRVGKAMRYNRFCFNGFTHFRKRAVTEWGFQIHSITLLRMQNLCFEGFLRCQ